MYVQLDRVDFSHVFGSEDMCCFGGCLISCLTCSYQRKRKKKGVEYNESLQ